MFSAGALGGIAQLFIVPADTATLDGGEYVFDVWVELVGGERKVIIPEAAFTVTCAVTRFA